MRDETCPVAEALDHPLKGISRRMLTLDLRRPERDGLLIRTVRPAVPPRAEYDLTPMARELRASLTGPVGWAGRRRSAVAEARAACGAAAEQRPDTD